jgi:NAD(P)-dependent dehydrogenase (short-subunit alcohol dehydrogenase family)
MADKIELDTLFRLEGRVALVTGASAGIGKRLAQVAAAAGAKVVLVARREDRLQAVKEEIEAIGGEALVAVADVTDSDAMIRAFDAAERAFGVVDLFVANAGVLIWERAMSTTPQQWAEVMSTNLDAVYFGSQEAARRLIAAAKPGAIVTISSVAGFDVPGFFPAYGIAKAGVIHATRLLASELASHRIRVNSIAPGWVTSEMTADYLSSDAGRADAASGLLGRAGEPSDLDGPFILLASDAGRHMTGATIIVGGFLGA